MRREGQARRPAKALVATAIMLPALCGVIGLVVDAGVLMTTRRQAQTAADAAARAAALERSLGGSDGDALVVAREYVQALNNLPGATVALNSPPLEGRYAGDSRYIEVVVTAPVDAHFIPVVGGPSNPVARARAVAGPELEAAGETILCLDPNAVPGFTVDRCEFEVRGRMWVNSQGAGSDETGGSVNLGLPTYGARILNGGSVQVEGLRIVGGVDNPSAYQTKQNDAGFKARQLIRADPLLNLPTPTTSNGVLDRYPGLGGQLLGVPQHIVVVLLGGLDVTLQPGIYASITVTGPGPGSVTFEPGIYVLRGGNALGQALHVETEGTVTGSGVMFYNTGSTYDPVTGGPDAADGNDLGTEPLTAFGTLTLNAEVLRIGPVTDPGSPFKAMLLYQRRWNTRPMHVYHNSTGNGIAGDELDGTIYAKWAHLTVHGPGTLRNQYVVGSLTVTAPAARDKMTIDPPATRAKAKLVYLVE